MRRLTELLAQIFLMLVLTGTRANLWGAGQLKEAARYELPNGTEGVLIPMLIAFVLGLVIGLIRRRHRTHALQNRGEALLSRELSARFVAPDFHLLNHITVRVKDGTTQIDHILVSRFGIFVIETKDYSGWIFANSDDRYWTQVIYRVKHRFQNPIRQNYKHVCAVRELLDFVPANDIRSIVVFTGESEFKTDIPDGVFFLSGFLAYVARQSSEVMSVNRLQFCVGRLETARLSISKATDVEHVRRLRSRYGVDD